MSTSRPAAGTFAANLNASHPIVANAVGLWVVDADASVPDLTTVQPSLVRNGVIYAETGTLGGHFVASTPPSYAGKINLASSITNYPVVLGCVFSRTGTKSPGSGIETLFSIGDSYTGTANTYAGLFIDDGTDATNAYITARGGRLHTGGNPGAVSSGTAYTADALHTAVIVFYYSTTYKAAFFLDGVKKFDDTVADLQAMDAADAVGEMAMLLMVRGTGQESTAFQASTATSVALGFVSSTKLTDQDYIDWTADPWSITGEAGPTLVKYYPTADKSNAGSWTGEGDETTNLYSHLDETTPSDSDYIQSPLNPTNAAVELYFGDMTNPPVDGTSHTIRYRMGASGTLDGLVELVAGDDYVVQSWTHEPVAARVAGVDNLFEQTVSTTNTALWLTHGYDGSYIRFTAGT